MIINLWRKRQKLKFLSLLIVNVGLLIIYSNFENLTAEVRSFLVYNTPIKAIPAPLWTQVKNVFLKKSSWRTNGNLTDSVISGCTLPQVSNRYSLTLVLSKSSVIIPARPLGSKHPPLCLSKARASVPLQSAPEAALHAG